MLRNRFDKCKGLDWSLSESPAHCERLSHNSGYFEGAESMLGSSVRKSLENANFMDHG